MSKKRISSLFILGLIVCAIFALVTPVFAAENSAEAIPDAGTGPVNPEDSEKVGEMRGEGRWNRFCV